MTAKKTRLSDDFVVSPRIMELAQEHSWPDPRKEIDRFKDYHIAHGTVMADWEHAFRFWLSSPVTKSRTPPMPKARDKQMQLEPIKPDESRPEVSKVRSLISDLADKFDVRKKG